jgi:hypothetical protein
MPLTSSIHELMHQCVNFCKHITSYELLRSC